ncbi:molybdate transport repressor ModE-like protein [Paraburkholderia sp. JPY158]|uniref:Molybdate transport repressor ModE-like protein n=1 Tax=Paraburkholderia atlantica TaxID=2654982 RepID=A0A7W8Q6K9_PARAM|nr:LysR substrate-binding domain-containing protein [Paraburkholderia atlantica]MBB5424245.1 molybdate transport repressor ModE-like protein [Paraburkholderia atlantica]
MKLHQLNTLAAIADTGSIRAAARSLGLSPAAVTKAMRELEADLHAPLIVRSASGVAFTEFGRALVVHARLVLGQLQRAQAEIDALRGAAAGKLSIGVTPWVALTFLPPAVRRFRERMPDVQLEFFEGLLAVVQPRLRDGSLDFSIGRPPPASPPASPQSEFQNAPLFSTHAAVVARRDHPKAGCRTLLDLQDEEWILNWDPASRESMSNNLFVKRGMRVPQTIVLAHSLSIVLGLLAHTDMVSIFPWPLVEAIRAKENLWALPLRETLDETIISITSRRGAPTSPAAACFLDCLRETIDAGARSPDPEQRRLFHSIELML